MGERSRVGGAFRAAQWGARGEAHAETEGAPRSRAKRTSDEPTRGGPTQLREAFPRRSTPPKKSARGKSLHLLTHVELRSPSPPLTHGNTVGASSFFLVPTRA